MELQITEKAAEQLRNVIQGEGAANAALRVGVGKGGCCGPSYSLSLAEAAEAEEHTAESQGIKVFVPGEHVTTLNGIVIDFVETPMGTGFHISNPNVKEEDHGHGGHGHGHGGGGCACAEGGGGGCGCGSGGCGC
jgi:iron-sulfur cluster assembly protein